MNTNVETPRAIANVVCYQCQTPIRDLRSFKCHNWAYARPALLKVFKDSAPMEDTLKALEDQSNDLESQAMERLNS